MTLIRGRRVVGVGLGLALLVAACGGSSSTANPIGGGGGGGGGNSLTSGLSSNLDQLTSYRFSWTVFGASSGGAGSPMSTGSFATTGVVINKPTKAISVNSFGLQYIQVGSQTWSSFDGTSWYPADTSTDISTFLPTKDYAQWFDTNSTQFTSAGDETKNGVACTHFKGNSSLSALYAGIAGVSANFQADLWVAKEGNYPVSGVYGFTASAGGQAGSFGYSFDITNVNDASNQVTAPTNVIALPS